MSAIEQKVQYIKDHIGTYSDFPQEGIVFRDIFAALTNGQVCQYLRDVLVAHMLECHPDVKVIIGLESRGFLFNLLVAAELGMGCAPIRKKGKLPGDCYQVAYKLEYGEDVFEMQKTAIQPGQQVVIIDDLLATGGTLDAAIQLVRKAGAVVDGVIVVMELTFLEGRKKLDAPNIHSLIQY